MKVTIRKRLTSIEKTALYLDVNHNGKRTKESLNLFLYNTPKNKLEQIENKKTPPTNTIWFFNSFKAVATFSTIAILMILFSI